MPKLAPEVWVFGLLLKIDVYCVFYQSQLFRLYTLLETQVSSGAGDGYYFVILVEVFPNPSLIKFGWEGNVQSMNGHIHRHAGKKEQWRADEGHEPIIDIDTLDLWVPFESD